MANQILINRTFSETRVALIEDKLLAEIHVEQGVNPQTTGNVYKGKVQKVVHSMKSAFIDIGCGRSGFLSLEDIPAKYFGEYINEDENSGMQTVGSIDYQELTEGQSVIVQVIKQPVGTKGPKLTSYISIPGKFLILIVAVNVFGVSNKITDERERDRLVKIMQAHKQKNIGFIMRTFSEGVSEDIIVKEIKDLTNIWKGILRSYKNRKKPALLYETPDLTIRTARDLVNRDTNRVVVDSPETETLIKTYLASNHHGKKTKVVLHKGDLPLFEKYKIESEIENIYKKKVILKSGGFLIIEETEGLTVIDVNTGKYTSCPDQERSLVKLNTEAAKEAARQIRLRNLVGIIVIDFINMKKKKSQNDLYEAFRLALSKDKARLAVQYMSEFSVVQLTRQRTRESILNTLAGSCINCNGTGKVKSVQTISYEIIRKIESSLGKSRLSSITVEASENVINYIFGPERDNLSDMESKANIDIDFAINNCLKNDYNLQVQKYQNKKQDKG